MVCFFFNFVLLRGPRVTVLLGSSFKQTKLFSSAALLYNK